MFAMPRKLDGRMSGQSVHSDPYLSRSPNGKHGRHRTFRRGKRVSNKPILPKPHEFEALSGDAAALLGVNGLPF